MNFWYDLPNLFGIILVVTISLRIGLIPLWMAIYLGLLAFVPFFLNDVLFPSSYMPDQFKYLNIVKELRSFSTNYYDESKTVINASWLFFFIPLPFVETIKSLGFFNRFIATILIIWLYHTKKIRGLALMFLLFYPSFILYSSLALRDTFILIFMLVSTLLFIDGKRFLALLFTAPLFFIKYQNFFLMLVFFFVYLSLTKGNLLYRVRFFLTPFLVILLLPFIMTTIELIDFYRRAMFVEDGGDLSLYIPISNLGDFIMLGIQSAFYFLMKPFLWEVSNVLQLIQSIENLFILVFLLALFLRSFRVDRLITFKWIIFLLVAMTIYGIVVFNFGTAVRYKFPFIIMAVIGLSYELYRKYGFCLKLSIKSKGCPCYKSSSHWHDRAIFSPNSERQLL